MKKKFFKLLIAIISLMMTFTLIIIPHVEAALPVDVDKECQLEMNITSKEYRDDLKNEMIEVELYQVATISKAGNYTGIGLFSKIDWSSVKYDKIQSANIWKTRAKEATKYLKDEKPTYTMSLNQGKGTLSNLKTGLYLIVIQDLETAYYSYEFTPYLVSLPNNYYYSSDDDTWYYQLTGDRALGIKATRNPKYGSIEIVKNLENQNITMKDSATFVYQVDIETLEKKKETRFLTMYFDDVTRKLLKIDHIPAGSKVKVSEVYTGGGYQLVSDQKVDLGQIDAITIKKAEFTNRASNEVIGGNGIVNSYRYDASQDDYQVNQSQEN